MLRQLEGLGPNAPVLMIFEDAHWIDPTSRELLDLVLARIARLPVLLVVTFRPEFQHAWSGPAACDGAGAEPARAGMTARRWSNGSPATPALLPPE